MSKRVRQSIQNALYGSQNKRQKSTPGSFVAPTTPTVAASPIIVEDLTQRRKNKKKQLPKGHVLRPDTGESLSGTQVPTPQLSSSSHVPLPLSSLPEHSELYEDNAAPGFEGIVFEHLIAPVRERKV